MITHNLPLQSTPFVGRDSELAEFAQLLVNPACRLLTLTGPGGIGKTRLALEAAQRIIDPAPAERIRRGNAQEGTIPEAWYFVPLQTLDSPDHILMAIAEALHLQFHEGSEPRDQLFDYLHSQSPLLLLDNFEQLLAGVDIVTDLLASAPAVKVLITSRERLNLREEWVYEVGGLLFPISDAETEIEGYSAVQLFVQNARRVQHNFTLARSTKSAVARICRLVGGMPLGLELAAGWVRVLPCEAIADEIQRSLDILETPAHNVLPRHRNMRAAFNHSWNLLSAEERSGFKKLSVFRGGFTRAGAEFVAGATLRILSALVDKSLLRMEPDGRYQLHELLRQYGEEQLKESPAERAAVQDLHCTYHMDFVRQYVELMNLQGKPKEALQSMERELGNVHVAWRWAVEQGRYAELDQSFEALWSFFA